MRGIKERRKAMRGGKDRTGERRREGGTKEGKGKAERSGESGRGVRKRVLSETIVIQL